VVGTSRRSPVICAVAFTRRQKRLHRFERLDPTEASDVVLRLARSDSATPHSKWARELACSRERILTAQKLARCVIAGGSGPHSTGCGISCR
jgi:hypothetical protein